MRDYLDGLLIYIAGAGLTLGLVAWLDLGRIIG